MRLANPLLMLSVVAAVAVIGMARQEPAPAPAPAPDPQAAAPAVVPSAERGHALVQRDCGGCHAVEAAGDSPLAGAPPFRTLHDKYPPESLEEALTEGILSGHPDMPDFEFTAEEAADIVAWLKALEAA